MTGRILAAGVAVIFLAAGALPTARAEDKPASPQQQKMKTCAAQWKDEKAKAGAKGRTAYRTFMSDCLKKA